MYLYLLFNKVEALDTFKTYKVEIVKQKGKKTIKIVRSDKDEEYYSRYKEKEQI
jgi:hypothetical protein